MERRQQNGCGMVFGCAVLCACIDVPGFAADGSSHLRLAESVLEVGANALRPAGIASVSEYEYEAGDGSYSVDGKRISKLAAAPQAKGWSVDSDDGSHLRWMAATSNVVYLVGYQVDSNGCFKGVDLPPRVRRLDLARASWLPALDIPDDAKKNYRPYSVFDVMPSGDDAYVVVGHVRRTDEPGSRPNVVAYDVLCFRGNATRFHWRQTYPSWGEYRYAGAYAWGIPLPQYAWSQLRGLQVMDDKLLVCPGPLSTVALLDRATGAEIWRVDRIWELQRGFIGPSMFQFHIGRFGRHGSDGSDETVEKLRVSFDQQFRCSMIGGPVAVGSSETQDRRVFLAVSKGPLERYSGYLSDCVLYEMDGNGMPVSMTTLPQMVEGSRCVQHGDAIVWKCQNKTFCKIRTYRKPRRVVGGPDMVSEVVWLRSFTNEPPASWRKFSQLSDPVAFSRDAAFFVPYGGYEETATDLTCFFPLATVSLDDGSVCLLSLKVPNDGNTGFPDDDRDIVKPVSWQDQARQWQGGIINLEARQSSLLITVQDGDSMTRLSFHTGDIIPTGR